jgi:hypothetical protein
MKKALRLIVLSALTPLASAAGPDFSGSWDIDLRTPQQRADKVMCGTASFTLRQEGARITGEHTMAMPNCGQVNDGGPGTVKGTVVGNKAVLTVTNRHNGAVVTGEAEMQGDQLHWKQTGETQPASPKDAATMILDEGLLTRDDH